MITEQEYILYKQLILEYEKSKEVTPYWKQVVDEWFRFYLEHKGTDPNFTNGEQPALKRLMKKIRLKAQEAKIEWSQENAVSSFHIFLSKCITDKWIKDHFSLKNIDNQFDQLYARFKQQSPQQKNRNLDAQIASVLGKG